MMRSGLTEADEIPSLEQEKTIVKDATLGE